MSFYDELAMEYGATYHEIEDMLNCAATWDDYDDEYDY